MALVIIEAGGPATEDPTDPRVDFKDILSSLWDAMEVWRAIDTPDLATATLLDVVGGTTFRDYPDPGSWYYWVRMVTPNGQRGDFSLPIHFIVA